MRLRKLRLAITNRAARRALRVGRIAPSLELRGVLAGVCPEMVADVGANVGQFTLLSLMELGASRVVAFEPLSAPRHRFAAVFGADSRVRLHPVAIGPEPNEAVLHVSAAHDSSSLLPIGAAQVKAFPGTHEKSTEVVKVAPLTDFLTPDDIPYDSLLKIDVQGFELEALRGCELLLGCFRWALVEASFDELYEGQPLARDVVAWMADRGFGLSRADTTVAYKSKVPVQADFLFANLP